MTSQPSICIPIVGPTHALAEEQIARAVQIADWIEIRVDRIAPFSLEQLKKWRKSISQPLILTGAKREEIASLVELKPDYIDIDFNILSSLDSLELKGVKLISSFHDHEAMPSDLEAIFRQLQHPLAAMRKIAVKGSSSLDALTILDFIRRHKSEEVIATCMGEEGQNSRILAPIFGAELSFTCLGQQSASAPGQINAKEFLEVYHFRSLNAETRVLGVLGDPVNKSSGRFVHNAIFHKLGFNGVYVAWRLRPSEVAPFLQQIKTFNFGGSSVTMPLKECVIPYLDAIDPAAEAIGAVNTIVHKNGKLIGYNTDAPGTLDAIEEKKKVAGKRLVVIGAGGAARAIAYEAQQRGAEVIILNRTPARAKELAERFGCAWGGLAQIKKEAKRGYDFLIQSTSVGMSPDVEATPVDQEDLLPSALIMDIISSPLMTRLLRNAQANGCQIVTGRELYLNQALRQLELWLPAQGYNKPLDRCELKQSMREVLDVQIPRYTTSK